MTIRHISERDSWITNNDGDVIGVQVNGRADDPSMMVVSKPNQTGSFVTYIWTGTQAQYDAIATKDANTQYNTDAGIYVGDTLVSGGGGSSAIGGSISGATAGSVLFAGAGGVLAQDNSNLFWDNTKKQLVAPAFVQPFVDAGVGVCAVEFHDDTFSGIHDPTMFIGYNHINAKANHPQFYVGIEGYYYDIANGHYWSELYVERRDTGSSTSYRPFAVGTYDSYASVSTQADLVAFMNKAGNSNVLLLKAETNEIILGATAQIIPLGNNRYPYCGRTTGNSNIGLIGIDNTDSVIIGEEAIPVKISGPLKASQGLFFQSGTPDVGIVRDSAGVARLSNGSSGYGTLKISRLECGYGNRLVFRKADGTEIGNIYNPSAEVFQITNSQSSGRIEFANSSGTPVLAINDDQTIVASSSLKTGAPSGGTAAAWKFGVAATVSPTSPNRTIEIDVGGTKYFLAAKTTND